MHWLRSHPFALLFAGAGILLLVIVILINGKTIPSSSFGNQVVAIPTGNTLQDPGISQPYTSAAPAPVDTAPISSAPSNATVTPTALAASSRQSVTAQPSQSAAQTHTSAADNTETPALTLNQSTAVQLPGPDTSIGDSIIQQVYASIPSGISLPLNAPVSRTPSQQALYTYGNQAGLVVLSFENAHANMGDILKAWVDDRSDASATASAKQIATDMTAVGDQLLALAHVPASAQSANQNLARGYQAAAQQLLIVLNGGSDSHLVDSMKTYDTSAEDFTRSYVALADLFTQNGVTFSSSDMGNAFSFSSN